MSDGFAEGDPCVIVVGAINVDIVVTADHLPAPGETVLGENLIVAHGGKGANQAEPPPGWAHRSLSSPAWVTTLLGATRWPTIVPRGSTSKGSWFGRTSLLAWRS